MTVDPAPIGTAALPASRRYRAPWWCSWRQAQTWGAALAPLGAPRAMPEEERHEIEVAPGSRVRVHVTPSAGPARGTLLLLHGLAGHAGARLVRRGEAEGWRRGWTVVRMNYRTCGGTAPLASTLYNAGMSGDIAAVLESRLLAELPQPRIAIGYSLGGNMLLKYLGEAAPLREGEKPPLPGTARFAPDGPGRAGRHLHHAGRGSRLRAAVAVSPPLDLAATCRHLERPHNLVYHALFTAALVRLARRRHEADGRPGPRPAWWRTPTMRRFDSRFTAPDAGYASPEEYYRGASALPVLTRIDTPTLVITAKDDPIIPISMFLPHLRRNPAIRYILSERGGHCGWIERRGVRLSSWLAPTALDFLEAEAHRLTDRAPHRPAAAAAPSQEAGGSAIAP